MNNENNITQSAIEAERKAVDTVINILLIFTALLLAFCLGYFIAVNEALALVKTIVN
jgi:phosphate/sulfate permease